MKKLFTAIRKNDFAAVDALISKNPAIIGEVSRGAPKKDEGQSPLQVALKCASAEIVHLLLDRGADVNFMEAEGGANAWRTPVLHDAINRAVMCARWNTFGINGFEVMNTEREADEAFEILKKMIALGANVNGKDNYGNACLNRACLQARQILPRNKEDENHVLTPELSADIKRIFDLLIESGADMSYISPNSFGKTYKEEYGGEPVGEFLKY
jgi:ankyrin repeat protein